MVVGGGGLESDFSVHLWSKALVGTKLNKNMTLLSLKLLDS